MTWLVDRLNRRVQFMEQVQEPNATTGGYTQKYRVLSKVWSGCEPVGTSAAAYVRGVQINDAPTHKFTVRRSIPQGVATAEVGGHVKSDNFIYLLSTHQPQSGRLFRILTASNNLEQDEYIEVLAKEMGVLDTREMII